MIFYWRRASKQFLIRLIKFVFFSKCLTVVSRPLVLSVKHFLTALVIFLNVHCNFCSTGQDAPPLMFYMFFFFFYSELIHFLTNNCPFIGLIFISNWTILQINLVILLKQLSWLNLSYRNFSWKELKTKQIIKVITGFYNIKKNRRTK